MNQNRRTTLVQLGSLLGASAGLGLSLPVRAQQFTMKLSTTASADLDVEWLNALKAGIEAASQGKVN